jgi:GT2 family glycosyltransferase
MIALIVPVYKNFGGFAELMSTVDVPVLPIIIDNWVENRGVSRAWNIGLERARTAGCNRALIMNDDTKLEPGTIRNLGDSVDEHLILVSAINTRDYEPTNEISFCEEPDFAAFMVNPQTFTSTVGEFDENFSPAYFEDNDMHYRIKLAGKKAVRRNDAPYYHTGSVTQNWGGGQVVNSIMFERNKAYYRDKWGDLPGYEAYRTPFNSPNADFRHSGTTDLSVEISGIGADFFA